MEFPKWISFDKVLSIFRQTATPARRRIAAIGMFDGVHRGHQFLIDFLRREGEKRNLAATAVTFEQHPLTVVRPDDVPPMLGTLHQKMEWLREAGVEECVLLPFSDKLRHLTAREFLGLLKKTYHVDALVVGFNNHLGNDRVGSLEKLTAIGAAIGMEIIKAPECQVIDNMHVSSSAIRKMVADGDLARANRALGHCYTLEGTVVDGRKIGRRLGFPTANLQPSEAGVCLPMVGVYAVRVTLADGAVHKGMVNIGYRPTVGGEASQSLTIEVHIFDYLGYIYGETIEVEFVEYMRGEKKFASLEKLRSAIAADEQRARRILS